VIDINVKSRPDVQADEVLLRKLTDPNAVWTIDEGPDISLALRNDLGDHC
jgi:hypothetical protein